MQSVKGCVVGLSSTSPSPKRWTQTWPACPSAGEELSSWVLQVFEFISQDAERNLCQNPFALFFHLGSLTSA